MFYEELAPLGGILGPLKVSFSTIFAILDVFVFMRQFFHIVIYTDKKTSVEHFLSLNPCSSHIWTVLWQQDHILIKFA